MRAKSEQAVSYAARTDVGNQRQENEDNLLINTDLGLYVIADGMGGHDSGEVASRIAVDVIEQKIVEGSGLAEAIQSAHQAIIDGVHSGAGKQGMGTTVVAVQLRDDDYTLAWVGDSRAYLWDEGIVQISKDHSLVQMLIDSGQINEAQAREHPRKNIIYQNLGAEEIENFQVSVKTGNLYKNQKIILCSDGLSDEVENDAISDIVSRLTAQGMHTEGASVDEQIVENLVEAALENGGHDNVTVLVVSASALAPEKPELKSPLDDTSKDTLVPEK